MSLATLPRRDVTGRGRAAYVAPTGVLRAPSNLLPTAPARPCLVAAVLRTWEALDGAAAARQPGRHRRPTWWATLWAASTPRDIHSPVQAALAWPLPAGQLIGQPALGGGA